ncbi:type II methionyl aminopeptidase [Candidatus Woesearchaeota archaeon]|nr:type II methionyl aminopeptidase [Candidatus Woesearchaeota archaeon]
MKEQELKDYKKAGQIAAEVLESSKSLFKKGKKFSDIAEEIESQIIKKGGNLAFPVNLSCNEIAAHYTPHPNDELTYEAQLIKVDLGVHINGCVADTAITIGPKENTDLIEASKEALNKALKLCTPGTEINKIGKTIQETIENYGFKPIKNLSGHELTTHVLHSGQVIPNYNNQDKTLLKEDQVFAIEPFATTGTGLVKDGKLSTIYSLEEHKPLRANRDVLKYIEENYKTLPFAKRWLLKKFPLPKVTLALAQMKSLGIIREYSQLIEINKSLVSQAEHTVIIKDKPIITTKI